MQLQHPWHVILFYLSTLFPLYLYYLLAILSYPNNLIYEQFQNNWWICVFPSRSLLDDVINAEQQQQQEQQQQPEFLSSLETVVLTVFLSIIIIMTVFGNLLVMVALCKDRHLRWACFFIFSAGSSSSCPLWLPVKSESEESEVLYCQVVFYTRNLLGDKVLRVETNIQLI